MTVETAIQQGGDAPQRTPCPYLESQASHPALRISRQTEGGATGLPRPAAPPLARVVQWTLMVFVADVLALLEASPPQRTCSL